MINTRVEIEYEINLIEEQIRSEFNLEENWYGDSYGTLLENSYGKNLVTVMEAAIDQQTYDCCLNEIEKNLRNLAEDMKINNEEPMPAIFVYQLSDGRMQQFYVEDIMSFTHPKLEICGYVEQSYSGNLDRMIPRIELVGKPKFIGWLGPMWDGGSLRYETQEVYDLMSM